MNLHAIVTSAISSINPPFVGSVLISAGFTVAGDGTQKATYTQFDGVSMQVQALTSSDLKQIDSVNLSSIMRGVYMNGAIEGLDRYAGKGGDILVFNNQAWLVVEVLEGWDNAGWCKVAVTQQGLPPSVLPSPLVPLLQVETTL